MKVKLSGNWQSQFRRCVRDAAGNILRELVFPKHVEVELTDPEDLAAVQGDLGKALLEVEEPKSPERPGVPGTPVESRKPQSKRKAGKRAVL